MVAATHELPAPPLDRLSPAELRAQYEDLIDRYVRRRVADGEQAERIVRDVFLRADANPAQVRATPLPWLIGIARRECAQARSRYVFVP